MKLSRLHLPKPSGAILQHSVEAVVCRCPKKQMVRVYAGRRIACVAHKQSARDWATKHSVRQPMRLAREAVDVQAPISSGIPSAKPYPAAFVFEEADTKEQALDIRQFQFVIERHKMNIFIFGRFLFSLRSEIETHSRDAARFHEVLFSCEPVVTVNADACRFGRRKLTCANSRSDTKNLYIIPTQARPDCAVRRSVHSCLHNDYYGGITQHAHEKTRLAGGHSE